MPTIPTPPVRSTAVTVFPQMASRSASSTRGVMFDQTASRNTLRAGFTLVELLLVLGLFVVVIGISLPGIRRWYESMPLEQAVSLLQLQLQETRVAAVRSGESWCLVLPTTGAPGRRHPLHEQHTQISQFQFQMPTGIRCEVLAGATDHVSGRPAHAGRIVFHADGTAEQSCIRIVTEDGSMTTFIVNRLTGTATFVQYPGGARFFSCAWDNHAGASV